MAIFVLRFSVFGFRVQCVCGWEGSKDTRDLKTKNPTILSKEFEKMSNADFVEGNGTPQQHDEDYDYGGKKFLRASGRKASVMWQHTVDGIAEHTVTCKHCLLPINVAKKNERLKKHLKKCEAFINECEGTLPEYMMEDLNKTPKKRRASSMLGDTSLMTTPAKGNKPPKKRRGKHGQPDLSEIHENLAMFIYTSQLPFSSIESTYLRRACHVANPTVTIPSEEMLHGDLLSACYNKVTQDMSALMTDSTDNAICIAAHAFSFAGHSAMAYMASNQNQHVFLEAVDKEDAAARLSQDLSLVIQTQKVLVLGAVVEECNLASLRAEYPGKFFYPCAVAAFRTLSKDIGNLIDPMHALYPTVMVPLETSLQGLRAPDTPLSDVYAAVAALSADLTAVKGNAVQKKVSNAINALKTTLLQPVHAIAYLLDPKYAGKGMSSAIKDEYLEMLIDMVTRVNADEYQSNTPSASKKGAENKEAAVLEEFAKFADYIETLEAKAPARYARVQAREDSAHKFWKTHAAMDWPVLRELALRIFTLNASAGHTVMDKAVEVVTSMTHLPLATADKLAYMRINEPLLLPTRALPLAQLEAGQNAFKAAALAVDDSDIDSEDGGEPSL